MPAPTIAMSQRDGGLEPVCSLRRRPDALSGRERVRATGRGGGGGVEQPRAVQVRVAPSAELPRGGASGGR